VHRQREKREPEAGVSRRATAEGKRVAFISPDRLLTMTEGTGGGKSIKKKENLHALPDDRKKNETTFSDVVRERGRETSKKKRPWLVREMRRWGKDQKGEPIGRRLLERLEV